MHILAQMAPEGIPKILVGNKTDLEDDRKVPAEKAQDVKAFLTR